MLTILLAFALQQSTAVPAGEDPVEPYVHQDANAGARPFRGDAMWQAFHGKDGVNRIAGGLVARAQADRRIADIFKSQDMVRLRRTLFEQFCYLLGGGCTYSGRTMTAAHKNLGIQRADMSALVEDLQAAMREEHVAFRAQNRFLAKLAPMHRAVTER